MKAHGGDDAVGFFIEQHKDHDLIADADDAGLFAKGEE